MKKLVLFLTVIILFLSGCSGTELLAAYTTPEAVVEGYITTIIAKDFQTALQFYPAEQIERKFDKTAYKNTFKTDPMDLEKQASDFEFKTGYFAASFLLDEITIDPDTQVNTEWFEQFFEGPDMDKLNDLKIIRIDSPYLESGDVLADEDEALKRIGEIWGADDYTERIALVSHNGKTYLVGFILIKYDDSWSIKSTSSNYANIPTVGGAQPLTEEEYLKYIKPGKE